MASARELLEQADALMRRNRARDGTPTIAGGPWTLSPASAMRTPRTEIPILTQAMDRRTAPTVSPMMMSAAAQVSLPAAPVTPPATAMPAAPVVAPPQNVIVPSLSPQPVPRLFTPEVPELTDAIEEIDAALLAVAAQDRDMDWGEPDRGDDSVLGLSPPSVLDLPHQAVIDDRASPQFAALAEEVRMQVFQRIDMFTDTGLSEALAERLKPAFERASADLVAAVNLHVGEILRSYIADAIELELDRMRKSG